MAPLLPRFNAAADKRSWEKKIADIIIETDAPVRIAGATAAGDERKLRGIPAIGRGVTGAIPNTVPHQLAA